MPILLRIAEEGDRAKRGGGGSRSRDGGGEYVMTSLDREDLPGGNAHHADAVVRKPEVPAGIMRYLHGTVMR